MPTITKQIKETVQKLKDALQELTGRQRQWVLQPVRIKKIERADPRQ